VRESRKIDPPRSSKWPLWARAVITFPSAFRSSFVLIDSRKRYLSPFLSKLCMIGPRHRPVRTHSLPPQCPAFGLLGRLLILPMVRLTDLVRLRILYISRERADPALHHRDRAGPAGKLNVADLPGPAAIERRAGMTGVSRG
jgi:hypothetical protein